MSKGTYKEVLKEKNFMQYMIANLISRFGDSVDAIAYSWIMYEVTGNASLIAFILAVNYIPTICFQPFLAVLVERMEKKKVVAFSLFGRGLIVLCTMFLYLNKTINSGYLIVATLLTSTLEAFSIPAGSALVPKLIPMEKISAAQGLSTSAGTLVELVGTGLAGTIIAVFGTYSALLIDVVTFGVSSLMIFFLPFKEIVEKKKLTMKGYTSDLKGGFGYLKSSKILMGIIGIGMTLNMVNVPLNSFQSIYFADYLKLGAQALSVVGVTLLIGTLPGSIFAPKLGEKLGMRKSVVLSGILFCPFYLIAFLLPSFQLPVWAVYAMIIAGIFLLGLGLGAINVLFSTIFVQSIQGEYLARVSGITNALLTSMMPVMALVSSFLAIFLKVTVIFLIVGVGNLCIYLFVAKSKVFAPLDKKEEKLVIDAVELEGEA